MNKTVAIFINAETKGFLLSVAQVLEEKYKFKTKLISRDEGVEKFIKNTFTSRNFLKNDDIVMSDFSYDVHDPIKEAIVIEKKYKINLSMLISEDRGLGQGYLFNVGCIPNIIRADWPHNKKLEEIIKVIKSNEFAIEGCDFVVRTWPDKITSMICDNLGIGSYSLVPIKFGSRMFWSNDNFLTSSLYIQRIKRKISHTNSTNALNYEIEAFGDKVNKSVTYSTFGALKDSIQLIWNENKVWLRSKQKKHSYSYLAWLPSIFRRLSNYKYVRSISVKPSEINEYRICFFPLHLEPEVALLNYSPEFSNSMELVTWISKSLPADVILVLKEQALGFGVRSKWYYRQLNKIGNVVWADPNIHSWEWIKESDAIATITGTVGVEAIYMNKPVISYGAHQIINYLPSVFFSDSFNATKKSVDVIFNKKISNKILENSRKILQSAQIESSINFPKDSYEVIYSSNDLDLINAKKSLEHLFSEYPHLLKL
jgi:hypothetical protein